MKYPQNRILLYAVISALVALIFLSSCSCNYHMKRAEKKCGKTVIHDTLTVHDTIKVPEVRTDTIFKSAIGDTVYIDKDRLKIKYVRLPGDSVFIDGKCDSVIIYRTVRVPYEKTTLNFDWGKWIRNRAWLIGFILLIILLAAIVARVYIFPGKR